MPPIRRRPTPNRRSFLGLMGATTAVAVSPSLLTGCSSGGGGGGSASDSGVLDDLIPAHLPFEGVIPDVAGSGGAPDRVTAYADPPIQALPERPGSGGHSPAMTRMWGPIPPGLGNNSFYDYVNERIGATVEFNFQD